MISVCLETVAGARVASVQIARFKWLPEVIIWGNRVFGHHELFIYREVFAYTVPA